MLAQQNYLHPLLKQNIHQHKPYNFIYKLLIPNFNHGRNKKSCQTFCDYKFKSNKKLSWKTSLLHPPFAFRSYTNINENDETMINIFQQMNNKTQQLIFDLIQYNTKKNPTQNQRRRRVALSRAITLVESQSPPHRKQAHLLLSYLHLVLQEQSKKVDLCNTFRIGIAGPPGAGKSSFIETLGLHILKNHFYLTHETNIHEMKSNSNQIELVVLCIDPSSTITGGSILGDKTRMTLLSKHPNAFVRPSPTGGHLGGLTTSTADTISLCECLFALEDNLHTNCNNNKKNDKYVIVETVGLGQSEVDISQAVDMVCLILPPTAGDELQGFKKGIVEIADMIIVNKADSNDSDLYKAALFTANQYKSALPFLRRHHDHHKVRNDNSTSKNDDQEHQGWGIPPVMLASAHTKEGIPQIWQKMTNFRNIVIQNQTFHQKRKAQNKYWIWNHLKDFIYNEIQSDPFLQHYVSDNDQNLDIAHTKNYDTMTKKIYPKVDSHLFMPRISSQELFDTLLKKKWIEKERNDSKDDKQQK